MFYLDEITLDRGLQLVITSLRNSPQAFYCSTISSALCPPALCVCPAHFPPPFGRIVRKTSPPHLNYANCKQNGGRGICNAACRGSSLCEDRGRLAWHIQPPRIGGVGNKWVVMRTCRCSNRQMGGEARADQAEGQRIETFNFFPGSRTVA